VADAAATMCVGIARANSGDVTLAGEKLCAAIKKLPKADALATTESQQARSSNTIGGIPEKYRGARKMVLVASQWLLLLW
jgi:hypothetical protein